MAIAFDGSTSVVLLVSLVLLIIFFCSQASRDTRRTITAYTMPWCGACKKLQPEWNRLNSMAGADMAVVQIDCTKGDCSACTHYPTIISNNLEYKGPRTAEAMRAWCLGM